MVQRKIIDVIIKKKIPINNIELGFFLFCLQNKVLKVMWKKLLDLKTFWQKKAYIALSSA